MFHTIMFPTSLTGGGTPGGGGTYSATITGARINFDLFSYLKSLEGDAINNYSTFNITFDSSSLIGAGSTSVYAFTTGSGWPSGAVLTLTNNGYIVGAGGRGAGTTGAGGVGGDAMVFTLDATLNNAGTIGGGGGGGGGHTTVVSVEGELVTAGGGGGAGYFGGIGGATFGGDQFGNNGTLTAGGVGIYGGGAGGALGSAGSAGTSTAGGAAGDAIHKAGFTVTVNNTGTIAGTVSATT